MPRWIGTCLDSMRRCCVRSELTVLTPDTVPDMGLYRRWTTLPPGTGTDCLRAALLYRYGGLWVDADTVMIRDPATLLDLHGPDKLLYSTWNREPDRVIAGYVYAPKGHPVACRWFKGINAAMEGAENVGWGGLGERMLTPYVRDCPASTEEIPLDTFLPVDIDADVERYFRRSGWRDFATDETVAFGLNHSWMEARKKSDMDADPAPSPLMVHRLLSDAAKGVTL